MKGLISRLFDFESAETAGQRIFYRAFEGFIILYATKFCWEWGYYTQQIDAVLLPLGAANYVDVSFMFDNNLSMLVAACITTCGILGFFRKSRFAYLVMLALFHLQYISRYCLGEISHGSNLVGMSLLVIAVGAVLFSDTFVMRRFVLGGIYFFLGIAYTSAAVCKIVGTGLGWSSGRHLWMWIAERQIDTLSKFGAADPNWLQQLVLEHIEVGTLLLTFGLLAELFGFLIWWPHLRLYVIIALIGMHLGVAVSMNILFDVYIYELILLVGVWPFIFEKLADHYARARNIRHRFSTQ